MAAILGTPGLDGRAANTERKGAQNALAVELGMRPLVASCHLDLGRLYSRTDKGEQAREHFTTATTMYREMGRQFWLEKAEGEMADWR